MFAIFRRTTTGPRDNGDSVSHCCRVHACPHIGANCTVVAKDEAQSKCIRKCSGSLAAAYRGCLSNVAAFNRVKNVSSPHRRNSRKRFSLRFIISNHNGNGPQNKVFMKKVKFKKE